MAPFYVGYLKLPPGLRGFLILAVAALLLIDVAAALLLFRAQPARSFGHWGEEGEVAYTGRFVARPYPILLGGPTGAVLLVGEGKEGAPEGLEGLDGARVEVRGYPILRGSLTVLQLDQPPARQEGVLPAPAAHESGEVEMSGEVVDTKCYAGAMSPGDGKAHKACASLCLFGGIPPLFAARGTDGTVRWLILADSEGGPVDRPAAPLSGDWLRLKGKVREGEGVSYFLVSHEALVALE